MDFSSWTSIYISFEEVSVQCNLGFFENTPLSTVSSCAIHVERKSLQMYIELTLCYKRLLPEDFCLLPKVNLSKTVQNICIFDRGINTPAFEYWHRNVFVATLFPPISQAAYSLWQSCSAGAQISRFPALTHLLFCIQLHLSTHIGLLSKSIKRKSDEGRKNRN